MTIMTPYLAKGMIMSLDFKEERFLKLQPDKVNQAKIALMITLGQSYKFKTKIIMKPQK